MIAVQKDPEDRLDYDIEFARWLSEGDSITAAEAVATLRSNNKDRTASLAIDATEVYGTIIKVWLSSGVDGESYDVTVTATTAQGRVKDQAFVVRIRECR